MFSDHSENFPDKRYDFPDMRVFPRQKVTVIRRKTMSRVRMGGGGVGSDWVGRAGSATPPAPIDGDVTIYRREMRKHLFAW